MRLINCRRKQLNGGAHRGRPPDELVQAVHRGLLVCDLWYTRVLDPKTLVATGLTRNGVFLIEDGKVGPPVTNLRTVSAAVAVAVIRAAEKQGLRRRRWMTRRSRCTRPCGGRSTHRSQRSGKSEKNVVMPGCVIVEVRGRRSETVRGTLSQG